MVLPDKFEPVSKLGMTARLGCAKLTSPGKRGGPIGLEVVKGTEMAFLVEVVGNGDVD